MVAVEFVLRHESPIFVADKLSSHSQRFLSPLDVRFSRFLRLQLLPNVVLDFAILLPLSFDALSSGCGCLLEVGLGWENVRFRALESSQFDLVAKEHFVPLPFDDLVAVLARQIALHLALDAYNWNHAWLRVGVHHF